MNQLKRTERSIVSIISITELGERYSYYILQSLLIFFLMKKFSLSQVESTSLTGTTMGVIYISSIVGGYIADKLLNNYLAALLGAILLTAGNFFLAFFDNHNSLYLGLAFISISTGLVKSNMSSLLSFFYSKSKLSEARRNFGFNVFYISINIGSFIALSFASSMVNKYGFYVTFYSCFLVSILIIINLIMGFKKLNQYTQKYKFTYTSFIKLLIILIAYICGVFYIFANNDIAKSFILITSLASLFILYKSSQKKYRKNVLASVVYFILSILFWSIFMQMFLSLNLFIDSNVAHNFLSFNISTSQFLSIEALGVIFFGGIVGWLYLFLEKKNIILLDIDKFNLSFIILTITLIFYYITITSGNLHEQVPAIVFIIGFTIMAISELFLSALGLSVITKIAPPGFVSLYMAIWLVSVGLGAKLAGYISTFITIIKNDNYLSRINVAHGILILISISVIGSLICFFSRTSLKNIEKQAIL